MPQAVILAGGLGTRLYPLTQSVPKAMIVVAGKPFIEWQIEYFSRNGIKDILLLTGHLSNSIEESIGNGRRLGVSVTYSREHQLLGTGGAITYAKNLLEEAFILAYGDSYLPIECGVILQSLMVSGAKGLMTVFQDAAFHTGVIPNVSVNDRTKQITSYAKEGSPACTYIDAGMFAFRKSAFDDLSSEKPHALGSLALQRLISEGSLFGYKTGQRFYDMGTPLGLSELEVELSYRRR